MKNRILTTLLTTTLLALAPQMHAKGLVLNHKQQLVSISLPDGLLRHESYTYPLPSNEISRLKLSQQIKQLNDYNRAVVQGLVQTLLDVQGGAQERSETPSIGGYQPRQGYHWGTEPNGTRGVVKDGTEKNQE